MRFMVIVKATKNSEAGAPPSKQLLAEMGKYNEELTKAGVMLAGEGLHPSSKGARVRFSGDQQMVIDGPFAETKELVAGFWLWKCKKRSNGSSAVPIPCRAKRGSWKFARCSRPRASERSLRRSLARRKSGCAPKSGRTSPDEIHAAHLRRGAIPRRRGTGKCYAESAQLCRELDARGQYVSASPLQPVATATSIRLRNGKPVITDGPFAETREQLGGYFMIEARDLNDAIRIATQIPAARWGTVEVRPVMEIAAPPQAEQAKQYSPYKYHLK